MYIHPSWQSRVNVKNESMYVGTPRYLGYNNNVYEEYRPGWAYFEVTYHRFSCHEVGK
jgi:hypothetical protein